MLNKNIYFSILQLFQFGINARYEEIWSLFNSIHSKSFFSTSIIYEQALYIFYVCCNLLFSSYSVLSSLETLNLTKNIIQITK